MGTSFLKLNYDTIRKILLRQLQGIFYDFFLENPIIPNPTDEEIKESGMKFLNYCYGLRAIKELSEPLAKFWSYFHLLSLDVAFELDLEDLADCYPLSNLEAFEILHYLNNSQLNLALSSLTKETDIRFGLLNAVKGNDYDSYSQILSTHNLSPIKLNTQLCYLKLRNSIIISQNNLFSAVDSMEEGSDLEATDLASIARLSNVSQNINPYLKKYEDFIFTKEMADDEYFNKIYNIVKSLLSQILTSYNEAIEMINDLADDNIIPFTKDILKLKESENLKFIRGLHILPLQDIDKSIYDIERYNEILNEYINDVNEREKEHLNNNPKLITNNPTTIQKEDVNNCNEESYDLEFAYYQNDKNNSRLPYPYRIEQRVSKDYRNEILRRLYNKYGDYFLNFNDNPITEDEFVYFLGGSIVQPKTYNPPYYWSRDPLNMASLIRLLYDGQPHGFDKLIMLPQDKGKDKSSIQWSHKTQGLGKGRLKPIDGEIKRIVKEVSGELLREVSLERKNPNKPKKKEKISDMKNVDLSEKG